MECIFCDLKPYQFDLYMIIPFIDFLSLYLHFGSFICIASTFAVKKKPTHRKQQNDIENYFLPG